MTEQEDRGTTSAAADSATTWIECFFELANKSRIFVVYPKGAHNSNARNCYIYGPAESDEGVFYWKHIATASTRMFLDTMPKYGAKILSTNERKQKRLYTREPL
jgi:hypothetical protein